MRLTPARDATPAGWLVGVLRTFGESVTSFVPSGFESYVRVFHPAYRRAGLDLIRVPWVEIAAARGKDFHPAMQLSAFTGSDHLEDDCAGVFDEAPETGSLPLELAPPLASALARHTATPELCWFAVWSGFGGLRQEVRAAPMFRLPGREYHLLTGPVDAVTTNVDVAPFEQTPNLWWPEDHAWCVATEVDLSTTYIACSQTCCDQLIDLPDIEALAIDPSTAASRASLFG
jgi:hypothetical protein